MLDLNKLSYNYTLSVSDLQESDKQFHEGKDGRKFGTVALASITLNNGFTVQGIKIVEVVPKDEKQQHGYFVQVPQVAYVDKDGKTNYYDTIGFTQKDIADKIKEQLVRCYKQKGVEKEMTLKDGTTKTTLVKQMSFGDLKTDKYPNIGFKLYNVESKNENAPIKKADVTINDIITVKNVSVFDGKEKGYKHDYTFNFPSYTNTDGEEKPYALPTKADVYEMMSNLVSKEIEKPAAVVSKPATQKQEEAAEI